MPSSPGDLHVVIGLGRSGLGAARLLQRQGHRVVVLEQHRSPSLEAKAASLQHEGIAVQLGITLEPASLSGLPAEPASVVVSPGIRWDHPALTAWRARGVHLEGELAPAWRASAGVPWIGITGTNGKTTVTHLVNHLLCNQGIDAPMGGNVGNSAAELVLERCLEPTRRPQWLVMELSSYQIEAAPLVAPRIGIWTTLTPDHLERHGSLEAYRAIKRGLLERSGVQILNADDPDIQAQAQASHWERACWVTAGDRDALPSSITPSLWIEAGQVMHRPSHGQHSGEEAQVLMPANCLAMPGDHNRQNMLLAVAAALEAGLDGQQMATAFGNFPGVPHRLERLRELNGVAYYNDSKATNYDAAAVALKALEGPLVVLAGGEAKIGDATDWLNQLKRQARAVILFGSAQETFAALLHQADFQGTVECCSGLAVGVGLAAQLAEQHSCRAVLLSPACASFDQYSDFEARGDHFKELVLGL